MTTIQTAFRMALQKSAQATAQNYSDTGVAVSDLAQRLQGANPDVLGQEGDTFPDSPPQEGDFESLTEHLVGSNEGVDDTGVAGALNDVIGGEPIEDVQQFGTNISNLMAGEDGSDTAANFLEQIGVSLGDSSK